jgi:phosphate transport system protein
MREVISALKVSTSLERIGDQSVNISRRVKRLNSRPLVPEVALLEPAYHLALRIFQDSARTFAAIDSTLAQGLKLRDKELDALTSENWRKARSPVYCRPGIDSQLLGSHLN